jgi:hypothetical protein
MLNSFEDMKGEEIKMPDVDVNKDGLQAEFDTVGDLFKNALDEWDGKEIGFTLNNE